MLSKSYSIFHVFARQKEEKIARPLTRQEWVNADRLVMAAILLIVIIGTILYS